MICTINSVEFVESAIYDELGSLSGYVNIMCKVGVTFTYDDESETSGLVTLFPLTDKNIQMGLYNSAFNWQDDKSEEMKTACVASVKKVTLASLASFVQKQLEALKSGAEDVEAQE